MMLVQLFFSIYFGGVAAIPTTTPDTAIASRIVEETVKYANGITNARKAPVVLVDVESFANLFKSSMNLSVSEPGLLSATRKNSARRATSAQAEDCPERSETCRTRDEGLFIQLTAIQVADATATATVTIEWTDHRPTGRTGIGSQDLRQEFSKVNGTWKLTKIVVIRTT